MPRPLTALLTAAGLVLAAALPASAPAGPWHTHTLGTGDPTFLRGLDARPDHVRLLVDERDRGPTNQLELRVGNSGYHLLDTARGTFQATQIAHDALGRPTVAWGRTPDRGGVREAFVWSAEGGRQELDVPRSVVQISLTVAPDGSAVLAASTASAIYAAQRPVDGPFGELAQVGTTDGFDVATGAGPGGRAIVAWAQGGSVQAVAAPAGAPFGPPQALTLPAAASEIRQLTATSTPSGRTVIAAQVGVGTGHAVQSTRIDAFDWAPGQPAPAPGRTLSTTGAFAGSPTLLARDATVVLGWTETTDPHVAARVLRTVRWSTGAEPSAPAAYRPARGMAGYDAPLIAAPAPGTAAARFFYRPSTRSARWYTVEIDGAGAAHDASSVTAPGQRGDADLQATPASTPLVAWTDQTGTTNAGYRVRTATP
jgi:hypothetical protein